MSITCSSLVQQSMDGLLQYRESMGALEREWLARRDAGQVAEIWDVNGGVDANIEGFTVLWIPEERVLWAFNCGLSPTWWGNATGPADILTLWSAQGTHLCELPYYVLLSATCKDCGRRVSPEEREQARIMAETGGDDLYYQCALCWEIRYAELCQRL